MKRSVPDSAVPPQTPVTPITPSRTVTSDTALELLSAPTHSPQTRPQSTPNGPLRPISTNTCRSLESDLQGLAAPTHAPVSKADREDAENPLKAMMPGDGRKNETQSRWWEDKATGGKAEKADEYAKHTPGKDASKPQQAPSRTARHSKDMSTQASAKRRRTEGDVGSKEYAGIGDENEAGLSENERLREEFRELRAELKGIQMERAEEAAARRAVITALKALKALMAL